MCLKVSILLGVAAFAARFLIQWKKLIRINSSNSIPKVGARIPNFPNNSTRISRAIETCKKFQHVHNSAIVRSFEELKKSGGSSQQFQWQSERQQEQKIMSAVEEN